MIYMKEKLKRNIKYLFLPYIFLVSIHIFLINTTKGPWLVPDEFINLAHARYFAGLPHAYFFKEAYTHFVYGLFISPSFIFFDSPILAYKFVIFLNGFYLSSLYIIFFLVLKKVFSQSDKQALIISLLVNFIPGIFSRSFFVVSENLFIPLFYLTLLGFYLFVEKMTYRRALFFALLVIFLYGAHYRAVVVLLVTIIYLLILYFFRRKKSIILAVFLMITGVLIVDKINVYLLNISWIAPTSYSVSPLLKGLLSLESLLLWLATIFGQFLYLFLASFGFIISGIVYCFFKVKYFLFYSGAKSAKDHLVMYFSILVLGIFLSSTLMIIGGELGGDIRFDLFTYGRYNEIFLPLLLALGLIKCRKSKVFFKPFFYLILILMYLFLYLVGSYYLRHDNYAIINITSIALVAITQAPWVSLLFIVLCNIILMYIFFKLKDINKKVLLLIFLFLLNPGFYFNGTDVLYKNNSFIERILPKIEASGAGSIIYDLPHITEYEKGKYKTNYLYWRVNYFVLQHSLPKTKIIPLTVTDNIFDATMVIAHCKWNGNGYNIIEKIIIDQSNPNDELNCMALYTKHYIRY